MKSSTLAVVIGMVLLLAGCGGSGGGGGFVNADDVGAIGDLGGDSGSNVVAPPAGGSEDDLNGNTGDQTDEGLAGDSGTGDNGDTGTGSGDNQASVDPDPLDGSQTGDGALECSAAGGFSASYKIDADDYENGIIGIWDLGGFDVVVDVDEDGMYWSASDLICAVVVKGGSGANAYVYPGGETMDSGLNAPINPSNGKPYGISHVTFCWNTPEEGVNE
jgi:hypothetical protein